MTDLKVGPPIGRDRPDDPDDVLVPSPRPQIEPPPAVANGVALSRLLAMARLTRAQAVELGADLLAAASGLPAPDIGSPGSQRFTVDQVVVGADGRVTLRAAERGFDARPPAVGPTGAAAGAVLADVVRAARPRRGPADHVAEQLLAELERAVTDLPVAGLAVVSRTLGEAAAALDRSAVRAELAALATALGADTAPVGDARWTGAGTRPGPDRPVPATRRSSGTRRNAGRRIGAWILSILVLAGVVVLEVAVLRDKVATDVGVLLDAGRSGSTPSAAPKPDGRPIVPVEPAAAGVVRGVDLRALAQCAAGVPCTVRLLVRVVPATAPQVVTWSYRIVDRCTGAVVAAPGGSVTVPAGGHRAAVVGTVPLPAGQAVGVVAVTKVPAVAASSPVLVGSCGPGTG